MGKTPSPHPFYQDFSKKKTPAIGGTSIYGNPPFFITHQRGSTLQNCEVPSDAPPASDRMD